jgi:nitrogenase molybdenum-iron protein beta chain
LLSCALEGVASVIAGIKDACVVIHSPQGCASAVNAAYDRHEIDLTKRKIGCTRLFESDIIMGATSKLERMIKQADENFKSRIMFVVGTCSADIIGEDMEAVCRGMRGEVGAKLIPIIAGGFRGNSNTGVDLGLEALLQLIAPSALRIKRTVNLIAPQATVNPGWQADLQWVKEILFELGISVMTTFACNTSLEEIEKAGTAQANLLLSHDAGYGFASRMHEIHGIPLILDDIPLPIGLENSNNWIRALGEHFSCSGKAEKIISRGEERVVGILRKRGMMMIPRYHNCRIAVASDMTFGVGLLRMLYLELEMLPELLIVKSSAPEGARLMEAELEELRISPEVVLDADGYQMKEALKAIEVDAVAGSAWESYIAEELGVKVAFDVFAPTNRVLYIQEPYWGYEGMLRLLQAFAGDWERAFRSKSIELDYL